jgi:hypothetical protein
MFIHSINSFKKASQHSQLYRACRDALYSHLVRFVKFNRKLKYDRPTVCAER